MCFVSSLLPSHLSESHLDQRLPRSLLVVYFAVLSVLCDCVVAVCLNKTKGPSEGGEGAQLESGINKETGLSAAVPRRIHVNPLEACAVKT